MSRGSDFAGKHGYTMGDIESAVLTLLLTHKCPVWSISQISSHLYKADSSSATYRHIRTAVYRLEDKGALVVDNWFDCNNVTVVYAKERMKPPVEPELPF